MRLGALAATTFAFALATDAIAQPHTARYDVAVGAGTMRYESVVVCAAPASCDESTVGERRVVTIATIGARAAIRVQPQMHAVFAFARSSARPTPCALVSALNRECDALRAPPDGVHGSATVLLTGRAGALGVGVAVARRPADQTLSGVPIGGEHQLATSPAVYVRLGSARGYRVEVNQRAFTGPGTMPQSTLSVAYGSGGVSRVFGGVSIGTVNEHERLKLVSVTAGYTIGRTASAEVRVDTGVKRELPATSGGIVLRAFWF